MHVHHPPEREGDSYHVVALTSSTLGSLKLDSIHQNRRHITDISPLIGDESTDGLNDNDTDKKSKEFSMGLIEAKTWSTMIDEKIPKVVPKTPIRTPPGEPETINAWELMEGLEDNAPLRPPHHLRSFSFHVAPNPIPSPFDHSQSKLQEIGDVSVQSMWPEMADNHSNSVPQLENADNESNSDSISVSNSNSTSVISEFDPDVISTFRKALEELPPSNPFHLKPLGHEKEHETDCNNQISDEKKNSNIGIGLSKCQSIEKQKVILYFTSLRGVRKTYEDCCHVRVILKGLGIRVDERDVSMHSGFREELKELLRDGFNGIVLPRVFVGENYIGGAEEIKRMHEEGRLEKVLEGCELVDDGGGGACEACGDIRFVPCERCSGSCKVYCEEDDEYSEDCDEDDEFGFQRCPDCNENGLIRCPICCD